MTDLRPMTGAQAAGLESAPGKPMTPTPQGPARVVVVDFDMSFGHLVGFFVKAALAAIPAALILVLISVAALLALKILTP